MKIKASGHSALLVAAGLFVVFAVPSQAAEEPDDATASAQSEPAGAPVVLHKQAKPASRHLKKQARRKSSEVAKKSSPDKKPEEAAAAGNADPAPIAPSVANANAQFASADTATLPATAVSARANDTLQTSPSNPFDARPAPQTDLVSADQLNDLDRALQETTSPAPAPAAAAAGAPAPAPAKPAAATSPESSAWDQTSLIGKLFIGFGALLTVASAARMFMA
jgi:hypothetical protein